MAVPNHPAISGKRRYPANPIENPIAQNKKMINPLDISLNPPPKFDGEAIRVYLQSIYYMAMHNPQ